MNPPSELIFGTVDVLAFLLVREIGMVWKSQGIEPMSGKILVGCGQCLASFKNKKKYPHYLHLKVWQLFLLYDIFLSGKSAFTSVTNQEKVREIEK